MNAVFISYLLGLAPGTLNHKEIYEVRILLQIMSCLRITHIHASMGFKLFLDDCNGY